MTAIDRIEMDPKVMMGKPVARGTRITVELLLRKLAEGATEADLLDAYPRLTREDIKAAIDYAAAVLERGTRCACGWEPCGGLPRRAREGRNAARARAPDREKGA